MNVLAEILSSRTRAEIFRLLFGSVSRSLHLREIERLSSLSTGSIRQETSKLVRLGLITTRKDGNRTYYEANRTHPLFNDIRGIVLRTSGLTDVLRDALQDRNITCAFIFGSVARGTEGADSDIDLMVIGDIGLRRISQLLSGVSDKVGREINPHAFSGSEFSRRLRQKEHLVSGIMATPKIFVVGSEHDLEAMGEQRLAAAAQNQRAGNR